LGLVADEDWAESLQLLHQVQWLWDRLLAEVDRLLLNPQVSMIHLQVWTRFQLAPFPEIRRLEFLVAQSR
jgi:hypothetical protein